MYLNIDNHNEFTVANQEYRTASEEEYVIIGNDALLKCKIPSFIADFVFVINWEDEESNIFYPNKEYGNESCLIIWIALCLGNNYSLLTKF